MSTRRLLGWSALTLVGIAMATPSPASASTYSVTSTADTGPGTLRQAILDANAHVGSDVVHFNLPGAGVRTIAITSAALPAVTDPLVIDGRWQPGFAGTPLVRVDNASGKQLTGMTFPTGQSQVLGLEITRFTVGVRLAGDANTVAGCLIGTDAAGDAGLGNTVGVRVATGANNRIGGTSSDAPNVVSGNTQTGIEIVGAATTATKVFGNRIGTDPAGVVARPNPTGISIGAGTTGNQIGASSTARNVISGNTTGVDISGAGTKTNAVQGNLIGTNAAGTGAVPNSSGVVVEAGASGSTIGGASIGARNLISGNTGVGVDINPGTTSNVISGNFIGTDVNGTANLANGAGVHIGASGNTVGGTVPGAGNLISGNANGVELEASGSALVGNRIGTDITGGAALGNDYGVLVENADGSVIGGTAVGARNLISGNSIAGVYLLGNSGNNTIAGNYIGTNAAGTAAVKNGCGVCMFVEGDESQTLFGNTVGGTTSGAGNVISGNDTGVSMDSSSGGTFGPPVEENVVAGNDIGTDPTASSAIPNGTGVVVEADGSGRTEDNTIGGSTAAARNVISGNTGYGVTFQGQFSGGGGGSTLTSNAVSGNYIGTDGDGTAALPNGGGVHLLEGNGTGDNTVGGTTAGARNVISGNIGAGVVVSGAGSGNDAVVGNYIGTKGQGGHALPNGGDGVRFENAPVLDRAEANLIAYNGGAGVVVEGGSGDSILGNSMVGNSALGIELVNGGNHDQTSPAITSVITNGAMTTIDGALDSTASTTFRIELFSNPRCDPSGAGEGKTFLGSLNATTDGTGHATFSTSVQAVPAGQVVTATATSQATGDTSEFSTCFTAP